MTKSVFLSVFFIGFLFYSCSKGKMAWDLPRDNPNDINTAGNNNTNNDGIPVLNTGTVKNIIESSATVDGTINQTGTSPVTAYGHCWSTNPTPTISNSRTNLGGTTSSQSFTSDLQNLTSNTKYYVRAYATNNSGTSYGNEVTFTTSVDGSPKLNTSIVKNISENSASAEATINQTGTSPVTAYGHCWSTNPSPTISNSRTNLGGTTSSQSFTSSLQNLMPSTKYYVRAYATNNSGTSYGNEISFTTLRAITEDLNKVTFIDNNTGFIAGSNVLFKTENGGVSWSRIRESQTIDFTDIFFVNPNLGYAGGNDQYYAYIYKTTDGGATWVETGKFWGGNERMEVMAVHATGGDKVTCLVNRYPNATQVYGYVYYSSNAGQSWTNTSASRIAGFNCADLINGNLVIGGNTYWDGTTSKVSVYSSAFHLNGQTSITTNVVDGVANIFGIDMAGTQGFAVGSEGKLFVSGNSGQNWSMRTINGFASTTFNSIFLINNSTLFIAGSSGVLLKSTDSGFTWNMQNTNTTERLNSIFIKQDGTIYVVGNKGVIIKQLL